MRIPYFEAAPPHALNAIEFPDDEEEAERSWLKWPLSASLRRRPLHTALVGTVFPLAIHRAGSGFWLLETRDTVDPRAVFNDSEALHSALDRERLSGGPVYHHFQLGEEVALRYILMAGYPVPDGITMPQPAASVATAGSDRTDPTAGPSEGGSEPVAGSAPPPSATRDVAPTETVSMAPPRARRIPRQVAIKRLMDGI